MKRIAKDGAAFVQTEYARVKGIIASGSVSEDKKRDFKRRLNILRTFGAADNAAAATGGEQKKEL